jgi:hypothetical protein
MLRLVSLFTGSTDTKPTNLTITANHSLRYVYPKTGQGGMHITNNHYSVKSMGDFDSVLDRLTLQCGPSAELAVGCILERETGIEMEGVIAGVSIAKCTLASVNELMDVLAEHGVNTTKLAGAIALK